MNRYYFFCRNLMVMSIWPGDITFNTFLVFFCRRLLNTILNAPYFSKITYHFQSYFSSKTLLQTTETRRRLPSSIGEKSRPHGRPIFKGIEMYQNPIGRASQKIEIYRGMSRDVPECLLWLQSSKEGRPAWKRSSQKVQKDRKSYHIPTKWSNSGRFGLRISSKRFRNYKEFNF